MNEKSWKKDSECGDKKAANYLIISRLMFSGEIIKAVVKFQLVINVVLIDVITFIEAEKIFS